MKILLSFALLTISIFIVPAQTPAPSPETKEATQRISDPAKSADNPAVNEKDVKDIPVNSGPAQYKSSSTYTRPDSKTRFTRYINGVVGPVALIKEVASAGFSTWRNAPEEWGKGWEGFGRRFASGLGKSAIKGTTTYILDESFKLDSNFYRSTKKSTRGRLGDAVLSTFTARKPDGKKVFGFPRIAGTYTASVVAAETWFPKRFNYTDGLRSGTISLGFNVALNVFREFFRK